MTEACPRQHTKLPGCSNCVSCRQHPHASGRQALTRCEKLAQKEQRKAQRQAGKRKE